MSNKSVSNGRSYCVMDYDLTKYNTTNILPLAARITALEGVRGLDGRELELKKGLFPAIPETPNLPENYGVMWRLAAREGEPEDSWQLLVFMHEIKGDKGNEGPEGPEGPMGPIGKGISIKGKVLNVEDLLLLSSAEANGCYIVLNTNEMWMFIGPVISEITSWHNLGQLVAQPGPKGDTGSRGPRGPEGPTGPSGGISTFLLNWIVSTTTNQVLTSIQIEISSTINDAIETMANQLANLAEDAAEAAVNKAIDEMMDQFKGDKGEKGDKGDKGDDGKDGAACTIVGEVEREGQLPFPESGQVGKGYLVGDTKDLYLCVEGVPGSNLWYWKNVGNIRGPKGENGADAVWNISVRDIGFVEKANIEVVSDLPEGVAGMYIQDTSSIIVDGLAGSEGNPDQVGFRMRMKYPIPTLVPDGSVVGTPTKDKFLTNDGTKLEWVDVGFDEQIYDRILMKSPDDSVFIITVSNDGRLLINKQSQL